ncbi:disease resistance protein RGA2-like isoform X1 [Canna indica]|uniref:Disease resistance protein RGA2-like isoform X1 n=1 Tax=Canna indica TaxID=4628 RepID=A0AAQ3QMP3_9LILI|nr:disease resistance protein RGA2-like isoform X1 [Canna indica]
MAGSMIGELLATAFFTKLADQVHSYIGKQLTYERDVKNKLKKLEENLRSIHAVIHSVERHCIENTRLETWLWELKDAALATEDVLDRFEYQLLESIVKNKVQVNFSSTCSTSFMQSTSSFFKRVIMDDEDVNELNKVVKRFDEIIRTVSSFQNLVLDASSHNQHRVPGDDAQSDVPEWRDTTSIQGETEILGREQEINKLVSLLTETGDVLKPNKERFSVVSIVGIGGVGKTTLAQCVYNDTRIDYHFDLKLWIWVSEIFDVKRITKHMLESICRHNRHQFTNLDMAQATLKEMLQEKRVLIILDDVWNEVRSVWENLRKPFYYGKEGSIILVTTRNPKVANMMGTRGNNIIYLNGLNEAEYSKFFERCAFGEANPNGHPKLKFIGEKIAKKLVGSPLAAKTVGGVLKSKLNEEHWRNIMESKLWQVEQKKDDIFPALKLSYEHLPTSGLKQCFAYFSLFPKNYHFDKERLIRMWMAQGFLESNEPRKRMEDIGQDYFDELLHRSFFQDTSLIKQSKRYVVHDLLHQLAESLSAHEYYRLEDDEREEIPDRVRHIYISSSNLVKVYENMHKLKNLRSLVVSGALLDNFSRSNLINFVEVALKQSKCLRAIVLDELILDVLPERFGHLKHLRYLEVPGSQLLDLPKSICRLYLLQGLSLQLQTPLHLSRELPRGMNKLINMRYLNINPEKISTISKIGKLRSLQGLKEFHVRKKHGYELGQLRDLRQLRGQLSIMNLDMVRNAAECREARLDNKDHLSALLLYWGHVERRDNTPHKHEEVLEALQPHPNLTELRITGYMGIRSPHWLKNTWLANLEHIELEDCQGWEDLPPLGQLPFLRILHLKSLKSVKNFGPGFYGTQETAFPSLEDLLFSNMSEWIGWSGVKAGNQLFPRLSQLQINCCHKLAGSLIMPSSLEKLHVVLSDDATWESHKNPQVILSDDVSEDPCERKEISSVLKLSIDRISLLTECLAAESLCSLYRLDIVYCSSLVSFTDEQEKWFQKLTSLKELRFTDCDNLTNLPSGLRNLASLETLYIQNVQQLTRCPIIASQTT